MRKLPDDDASSRARSAIVPSRRGGSAPGRDAGDRADRVLHRRHARGAGHARDAERRRARGGGGAWGRRGARRRRDGRPRAARTPSGTRPLRRPGADAPGRRALEDAALAVGYAAGARDLGGVPVSLTRRAAGGDVSVDLHRRAVGREIDRDGGDAVDVAQRGRQSAHRWQDMPPTTRWTTARAGAWTPRAARAGVHDVVLPSTASRSAAARRTSTADALFDSRETATSRTPRTPRSAVTAPCRAAHHALDAEDGGRLAGFDIAPGGGRRWRVPPGMWHAPGAVVVILARTTKPGARAPRPSYPEVSDAFGALSAPRGARSPLPGASSAASLARSRRPSRPPRRPSAPSPAPRAFAPLALAATAGGGALAFRARVTIAAASSEHGDAGVVAVRAPRADAAFAASSPIPRRAPAPAAGGLRAARGPGAGVPPRAPVVAAASAAPSSAASRSRAPPSRAASRAPRAHHRARRRARPTPPRPRAAAADGPVPLLRVRGPRPGARPRRGDEPLGLATPTGIGGHRDPRGRPPPRRLPHGQRQDPLPPPDRRRHRRRARVQGARARPKCARRRSDARARRQVAASPSSSRTRGVQLGAHHRQRPHATQRAT